MAKIDVGVRRMFATGRRYDGIMLSFRRNIGLLLALLLALCVLLSGCFSGLGPNGRADRSRDRGSQAVPAASMPGQGRAEERALLLLTEDRRLYEPITVERALLAGGETRARLALALGRVAHPEGLRLLEELLLDSEPAVRRNAAFAFLAAAQRGDLPETFVRPESGLATAVSDPDPDVARFAIQAMAVGGVGLEGCLAAVERRVGSGSERSELELWQTLSGALFFLPEKEALSAARLGLERLPEAVDPEIETDSERRVVRRELFAAWTARASDEASRSSTLALARAGLAESDPRIQLMAADLIGQIGDARDLEPLWALASAQTQSTELEIVLLRAAAVLAVGRLLARGVSIAPMSYLPELIERIDDPLPAVERAALEIVDHWLPDDALSQSLIERVTNGLDAQQDRSELERELEILSLIALARAEHPRAAELTERASRATERDWRVGAATAAAILGLAEPLERLSSDAEARVRVAVLEGRLQSLALTNRQRADTLRSALEDPSSQVRRAAYAHLGREPELGLGDLMIGLDRLPEDSVELRLAAVDAAFELAETTALERGGSIALLEKLVEDPSWPVRRLASRRLVELHRPPPPVRKPESIRGPDYYRGITQSTTHARRARLETTAGDLTLELACQEAPQTCVSLLQLAQQGFYDGLPFFQQGRCLLLTGDPDGDGYGGPGYRLRDEPVALRADRAGIVLVKRSAADAGSSQLAISLCAQHHLDGDWPAVGRIVSGEQSLGRLAAGVAVIRMREID